MRHETKLVITLWGGMLGSMLGSLSTGVDEVIFRIQFIYELGSFFRF
ncbi:hypothetical protein C7M38_00765 [Lactiplantibacillus plantarum]|nr:hypothetical protein C7M38_00765 [Lactiplantibacillus plantarum]QHM49846.1 hypothetical protein C7M40_01811 [Lactiplantibacillus plantarum]